MEDNRNKIYLHEEDDAQFEDEKNNYAILYKIKKYTTVFLVLLLLLIQSFLVGYNDIITIFILLLVSVSIFIMTKKIYNSQRELLTIYSKEKSLLDKFLSKRNTVWQILICLILSAFLGVLFMATTKGIILKQGYLPFFVILFLYSTFLYSLINKKRGYEPKVVSENFNEKISNHTFLLAKIFIPVLFLNIILTLSLSSYDTFEFVYQLNNPQAAITLQNFIEKTVEETGRVELHDNNYYSGVIINAYLLMDNFKLAFANFFSVEMLKIQGIEGYYFWG